MTPVQMTEPPLKASFSTTALFELSVVGEIFGLVVYFFFFFFNSSGHI